MEQNRPAPRRALSPKERRRRHRIRLVRNWTVFLLSCGAVMAVMTGGILWLLPRAYALIAPPTAFEAREYEGGAETDLSDKRLVLVNANLPLTEEPTPELAVADDATGASLEAEAAARAATVQPAPEASEYATGYGADILAADSMEKDTGFADTRAYEWLEAYAAEHGFILRWPQERQAATGMVFEPWHWRYVGRDNALAIRASGLSLEEYLALEQTK